MERYTIVKQIGKGSYGAVYLAKLKADRCAPCKRPVGRDDETPLVPLC